MRRGFFPMIIAPLFLGCSDSATTVGDRSINAEEDRAVEARMVPLTGDVNRLILRFEDGTLRAGSLPYLVPMFDENGVTSNAIVDDVAFNLTEISRAANIGLAVQQSTDGSTIVVSVPRIRTDGIWVDSDRIVYPAPIDIARGGAPAYDAAVEQGGPFTTLEFLGPGGRRIRLETVDIQIETDSGQQVSGTEGENETLNLTSVLPETLSVRLQDRQSRDSWDIAIFPGYRSSRAGLVIYTIRGVTVGSELSLNPSDAPVSEVSPEISSDINACNSRSAEACHTVAIWYQREDQTVAGLRNAADFLQRGCELDHMQSCYDVGVAFLRGEGLDQSFEDAASAFERACELDEFGACYSVAALHRTGRLPRDEEKEARLFRLACDNNVDLACSQVE